MLYGRVFAPATYVFFASALPALAFGQQMSMDTGVQLIAVAAAMFASRAEHSCCRCVEPCLSNNNTLLLHSKYLLHDWLLHKQPCSGSSSSLYKLQQRKVW